MAIFGPTVTLGVDALALGAALNSSFPQNSEQLAASRPYLAKASDMAGPVAARSAFGASVKSGYGYTRGGNPLQTFQNKFGTNFSNGMCRSTSAKPADKRSPNKGHPRSIDKEVEL